MSFSEEQRNLCLKAISHPHSICQPRESWLVLRWFASKQHYLTFQDIFKLNNLHNPACAYSRNKKYYIPWAPRILETRNQSEHYKVKRRLRFFFQKMLGTCELFISSEQLAYCTVYLFCSTSELYRYFLKQKSSVPFIAFFLAGWHFLGYRMMSPCKI